MSLEVALEVGRLYAPIKAISDIVQSSTDKIFLELPSLVAWWPGGPGDGTGIAKDLSNQRSLTPAGTSAFGYDTHPFVEIDGASGNYLSSSGFPSCLGTEAWVDPSLKGLTLGGWLWLNSYPTAIAGVIARWDPAANRGYLVQLSTSLDAFRFAISPDGTAVSAVDVAFPGLNEWIFICARFVPSDSIYLQVNGATNTTLIPSVASLLATTSPFEVGRASIDNTRIADGKFRDIFVCQAALPDNLIEKIRNTSAPS